MPSLERGPTCAGAWGLRAHAGAPQAGHRCTEPGAGCLGPGQGRAGGPWAFQPFCTSHMPMQRCVWAHLQGSVVLKPQSFSRTSLPSLPQLLVNRSHELG